MPSERRTERGLVYADEFVYLANPVAYVTCEIDNGTTVPALLSLRLPDAKTALMVDGRFVVKQGAAEAEDFSRNNGRVHFRLSSGKHTGRMSVDENAGG